MLPGNHQFKEKKVRQAEVSQAQVHLTFAEFVMGKVLEVDIVALMSYGEF